MKYFYCSIWNGQPLSRAGYFEEGSVDAATNILGSDDFILIKDIYVTLYSVHDQQGWKNSLKSNPLSFWVKMTFFALMCLCFILLCACVCVKIVLIGNDSSF